VTLAAATLFMIIGLNSVKIPQQVTARSQMAPRFAGGGH
jgi:hypothetical protein